MIETLLYKTRDLGESAALITLHMRLQQIIREGPICWFVFDNRRECEAISDRFFFGELMVNAKDYFQAIQTLKNRIYAKA